MNEDELKRIFANPFYAINISPDLCLEHEPMVTKEEWVKAASIQIEQEGAESFLTRMLDVLEGNFV